MAKRHYEGLGRRWWNEIAGFNVIDPASIGSAGEDMLFLDVPWLNGEIKNHKKYSISEWIKQTQRQAKDRGAEIGFVHFKRNKIGNTVDDKGIGQHCVVLTTTDFARIIKTMRDNGITEIATLDSGAEIDDNTK